MSYSRNIGRRCSFVSRVGLESVFSVMRRKTWTLFRGGFCDSVCVLSVSSRNDSFSFFDVVDSRNENGAICSVKENSFLTPLRNVMHVQTFGILSKFPPALS